MSYSLSQKLTAEALGTAMLVATVVGSGIMGDALSADDAVALLGNTIPTGAILVVLITTLGPISGAHFNPAVTFAFLLRRQIAIPVALAFIAAQVVGGIGGTMIAHWMFELPVLQTSENVRTGIHQWSSEVVATFGLVFIIFAGIKFSETAVPWLVGLYITAAYWFTASTSFANPAVAISRSLTDTFSGIRPIDLSGYIISEFIGAAIAVALCAWLLSSKLEQEKNA